MKTILLSLLLAFSSTLIASDLGKKTYEMTCQTCHDPRFAPGMHAPAAFNKQAWAIRFNKAIMESKNNPTRFKTAIDYLLYKVGTGKGLMPHGGLCKEADASNKSCSDEAIAAAIYYMAGMTTDN